MIPILLHTLIIPSGTRLDQGDWQSIFENKKAVFFPERKEETTLPNDLAEFPEDGNFPEAGIENLTSKETLFIIEDALDFSPFTCGLYVRNSWAVEDINESSNSYFLQDIPKIYEDILQAITPDTSKTKGAPNEPLLRISKTDRNTFDPENKNPYPVSMLTLWKVQTSRDFESGVEEVDGFSYAGPATVVPIKKIS